MLLVELYLKTLDLFYLIEVKAINSQRSIFWLKHFAKNLNPIRRECVETVNCLGHYFQPDLLRPSSTYAG